MTTTVLAVAARSIGYDTFDDLLPEDCHVELVRKDGALLAVTFSCDLDAAAVAAVKDRMTSRDDADQAKRATLRGLRDAVIADPSLENVAALAVANTRYMLGD